MGERGTEVTCRDIETGESETRTIRDDWMLVTDGENFETRIQRYKNGTAVLTLKRVNR